MGLVAMTGQAVQNSGRLRSGIPDRFPALVTPPAQPQPAVRARFRPRHWLAILAFVGVVICPVVLACWYLFARAQDQFASTLGFVVHAETEDAGPGLLSAMPGVAAFAGAASHDTDILYAFLTSQALVSELDQRLDLRGLWADPYVTDPVFAFDPEGSIEDLTRFWRRMVQVSYDPGPGLMEIEVRSFDPAGARAIALAIEASATQLINQLSGIARDDRLRHGQRELDRAEHRLAAARQALTAFRVRNRVVDPVADLQGELGVIHQLQQALAEEMIALDMLRRNTLTDKTSRQRASNDTRITQGEMRIDAIRQRIAAERSAFGDPDGQDLARTMSEYEALSVAVEVAQKAYTLALSAYEASRAAADRQTRYLASYSAPTLAERALYPVRWQWLAVVAAGALMIWSVLMLVLYSLRERY